MGRNGTGVVLRQDKELLRLPCTPLNPRAPRRSTGLRRCSAVARRRWPLVLALFGVTSAAAGLHLGVGVNLSRSEPRGIYRSVADTPARGGLVVVCLPAPIAGFGRARGYLGPGDCPGRTQPVLKRVGAMVGDVVQVGGETVAVNDVRLLTRPIDALDSAARPLPHVTFGSYGVAAGELWLFGSSGARSWDSRYFGPVPTASLRSVVRPVLTVE